MNRRLIARLALILPMATAALAPAREAAADETGYAAAVVADAPIAYWKLDESSGTTAQDSMGHASGAIVGSVTTGSPGPFVGSLAYTLDGASGYIDLGTNSYLFPQQWSIEFWFDAAAGDGNSSADGGGTVYRNRHYAYGMHADGDGSLNGFAFAADGTSAGNGTASGNNYGDSQWHYVVYQHSTTALDLWIDNVRVDTAAMDAGTQYSGSDGIAIGRDGSCSCSFFKGSLSNVAIYDHALTADRIGAHYAAAVQGSQAQSVVIADPQHALPPQTVSPAQPRVDPTSTKCVPGRSADYSPVSGFNNHFAGWEYAYQSNGLRWDQIGGTYAELLNYSPWVSPGTYEGAGDFVYSWVMLTQHVVTGHVAPYVQIGPVEFQGGERHVMVQYNDLQGHKQTLFFDAAPATPTPGPPPVPSTPTASPLPSANGPTSVPGTYSYFTIMENFQPGAPAGYNRYTLQAGGTTYPVAIDLRFVPDDAAVYSESLTLADQMTGGYSVGHHMDFLDAHAWDYPRSTGYHVFDPASAAIHINDINNVDNSAYYGNDGGDAQGDLRIWDNACAN